MPTEIVINPDFGQNRYTGNDFGAFGLGSTGENLVEGDPDIPILKQARQSTRSCNKFSDFNKG